MFENWLRCLASYLKVGGYNKAIILFPVALWYGNWNKLDGPYWFACDFSFIS